MSQTISDIQTSELQKTLISQSSFVFHSYFDRDMPSFLDLLDPDFVWIGSYEFQHSVGIEQFINITRDEQNEIPAQVFDEEYKLLSHEKNTWIVYGCFSASAWKDETTYLYTRQRATLIWRLTEKGFRLLHLHCTMARDIPLVGETPLPPRRKPSIRWYEYMQLAEKDRNTAKKRILIKDINGNIHYLLRAEILYIQISYRISTIYTGNGSFEIRKNLNQLLEELPFLLQVHKSWLVNPIYIAEIKRYVVTLSNKVQIPVGKSRYNEVKENLKMI